MSEELTRNQDAEEQQEESGSAERGAALPEGRAGGRRGETARQLIRRAKQATRRRFPAEEKIRIVMEGIRAEQQQTPLTRVVEEEVLQQWAESGVTSPVMLRIIDRWWGPGGPRFRITFGGTRLVYDGYRFGSQKGNSG